MDESWECYSLLLVHCFPNVNQNWFPKVGHEFSFFLDNGGSVNCEEFASDV